MKIRTGFVSNSSSSSFVIAKCYMTAEDVASLRNLFCKHDWFSEGSFINEGDLYFIGTIRQTDYERVEDWLKERCLRSKAQFRD